MRNLKKVLVRHIIDTTPSKEIPNIVQSEYNGDYKMYLYTLKTSQLGDMIMAR
tara:strand:- start:1566 stop:1724 length:159 start_codon:yes stop_codon:yes gene_type:complete